jgi:outer membrane protein assembly factor BamB
VDENDRLAIQPAWASRDIPAPGTPMTLNGVVFLVSNGEYRASPAREQRGRRSVLYALDAATGKELWNSGTTMTSFVPGVPPSGGDGQVYIVTADGTLYAFGIPLEH